MNFPCPVRHFSCLLRTITAGTNNGPTRHSHLYSVRSFCCRKYWNTNRCCSYWNFCFCSVRFRKKNCCLRFCLNCLYYCGSLPLCNSSCFLVSSLVYLIRIFLYASNQLFSKLFLAFSSSVYYTVYCRKINFYNPLLIIYTPLKRPMAPPSVFYFILLFIICSLII